MQLSFLGEMREQTLLNVSFLAIMVRGKKSCKCNSTKKGGDVGGGEKGPGPVSGSGAKPDKFYLQVQGTWPIK